MIFFINFSSRANSKKINTELKISGEFTSAVANWFPPWPLYGCSLGTALIHPSRAITFSRMRVLGAFCVHVCVCCVRVAGAQNEFRVASQVSILIQCTTLRVPITSASERERKAPSSATPRTNRLRDDDAHAALSDWQPTLFSGAHKFEFSDRAPAPPNPETVAKIASQRVALGLKSKFYIRAFYHPRGIGHGGDWIYDRRAAIFLEWSATLRLLRRPRPAERERHE